MIPENVHAILVILEPNVMSVVQDTLKHQMDYVKNVTVQALGRLIVLVMPKENVFVRTGLLEVQNVTNAFQLISIFPTVNVSCILNLESNHTVHNCLIIIL